MRLTTNFWHTSQCKHSITCQQLLGPVIQSTDFEDYITKIVSILTSSWTCTNFLNEDKDDDHLKLWDKLSVNNRKTNQQTKPFHQKQGSVRYFIKRLTGSSELVSQNFFVYIFLRMPELTCKLFSITDMGQVPLPF